MIILPQNFSTFAPTIAERDGDIAIFWNTAENGANVLTCFSLTNLQTSFGCGVPGSFSNAQPATVCWNGNFYFVHKGIGDDPTLYMSLTDLNYFAPGVWQIQNLTSENGKTITPRTQSSVSLCQHRNTLIASYSDFSTGAYAYIRSDKKWLTNSTFTPNENEQYGVWSAPGGVSTLQIGESTPMLSIKETSNGSLWCVIWQSEGVINYATSMDGLNFGSVSNIQKAQSNQAPAFVNHKNQTIAFWVDPGNGLCYSILSIAAENNLNWSTPFSYPCEIGTESKITATSSHLGILIGYNDPNQGVGLIRVHI